MRRILFNLIILFVVELKKLEVEGFGVYVDKTMEVDKLFPAKNCFAAFVKKDLLDMPDKFFEYATASECTKDMYVLNYDKSMDTCLKKVAAVYHPDKHRLEGVQGQWVTPPQAGNNRSKPKCGLFSKINFSCCSTFYTNVDYVPCFIESR